MFKWLLLGFGALGLGQTAFATEKVYEHCLVDESQEIRQCFKQVVNEEEGYSQIYLTAEFYDFFWFRPQITEAFDYVMETQDYLDSLKPTDFVTYYYDHNLLYQMYFLGEEEALRLRAEKEADSCSASKCGSAVIAGSAAGASLGAKQGAETGAKVGGSKGALAGAVIGGTIGAIGGAAGGYSTSDHCGCSDKPASPPEEKTEEPGGGEN